MKFTLNYDKKFLPVRKELDRFRENVLKEENLTAKFVIERNGGFNYVFSEIIFKDESKKEENYRITERLVKSALWIAGGYKIYVCAPDYLYKMFKLDYSSQGKRKFDHDFMSKVYEKPFEVVSVSENKLPKERKCSLDIGGHLDGCRIGFDAGGSDRKVSAVINGKVVYSEEVVWNPKLSDDWHYQYDGIMDSMKRAASKMPRVDAIGVSSAGVYVDDKIMVASLFMKIPSSDYEAHVKNMYVDIGKKMGAPLKVANDGDVTALAGAITLKSDCVLGIAMGTSEAGGYINREGKLNDWLSELAFVPVDLSDEAMVDEWSGDKGVGVKYFSQDGIIKLAGFAGVKFDGGLTPAQKLKVVQKMLENGNLEAEKIYEDVGTYLGYSVAYYSEFYEIKNLLLLGRVTSGKGGQIIIDRAKTVLSEEYPELAHIKISLPDEEFKRVGQSIAAASLTKI